MHNSFNIKHVNPCNIWAWVIEKITPLLKVGYLNRIAEIWKSIKLINYDIRTVERLEGSNFGLEEVPLTTIGRNTK